jgi:hypothetical protein
VQDPERWWSAGRTDERPLLLVDGAGLGSGVGPASETVVRSPSGTLIVATGCERAPGLVGVT